MTSSNRLPTISEIKRMWPDLSQLYGKLVDNAYAHPDDHETTHNVLLRLQASLMDLYVREDPLLLQVWSALSKTSCDTTNVETASQSTSVHDQEPGQNPLEKPVQSDLTQARDLPPAPASSPEFDISTLASLTGPSLNSEELQQIFSFMSPYMLGLVPGDQSRSDACEDCGEVDEDDGNSSENDSGVGILD